MAAFAKSVILWPKGIVPYKTPDSHPFWGEILAAMLEIHKHTVVRFVPWNEDGSWVEFTSNPVGNHTSSLGVPLARGPNIVNIDKNVRALHELGHVLGMIHEHQRTDRDDYITVEYGNLSRTGDDYSFDAKESLIKKLDMESATEYDIGSVEQYWWTACSAHGRERTMTYIANRDLMFNTPEALSLLDIVAIDNKYGALVARVPFDRRSGVSDAHYDGPLWNQYLDTNTVICPPGKIIAGFQLWKRGNRVAPMLWCTNPDGTGGEVVLTPVNDDGGVSDPGYVDALLGDQYLDVNPVMRPSGQVVAGFQLWKRGNRVALKLWCRNPDGTGGDWVFNAAKDDGGVSDPGYVDAVVRDQYLDTNRVILPSGSDIAGFAFWKRGNRVAPMVYL